jgi:hypothetical protein
MFRTGSSRGESRGYADARHATGVVAQLAGGGELPYDPGTARRRIKSNTFSHLPVLGSIRTAAEQLLIGAQYANNALLLDPPGLPTKKNYPDA